MGTVHSSGYFKVVDASYSGNPEGDVHLYDITWGPNISGLTMNANYYRLTDDESDNYRGIRLLGRTEGTEYEGPGTIPADIENRLVTDNLINSIISTETTSSISYQPLQRGVYVKPILVGGGNASVDTTFQLTSVGPGEIVRPAVNSGAIDANMFGFQEEVRFQVNPSVPAAEPEFTAWVWDDEDSTLKNINDLSGPVFLHLVTQKGKGYLPAEKDPIKFHALSKIESSSGKNKGPKYQEVFGEWLCEKAEAGDESLVAITPAMSEGSGMTEFAQRFPNQFFDVAIAEQHSMTFAAGLACEGKKPVLAIYSTFLQRAYDQLIHDVAIQNLDILLAIDRAGFVGEDGATHAGIFDLTFLRCIPNLTIMVPANENECWQMLEFGYSLKGPVAVRYPRGNAPGENIEKNINTIEFGKAKTLRLMESSRVAILSFGSLLDISEKVAKEIDATLVDMRFVKPLDESLLMKLSHSHGLFVTVEENVIAGGAGSAVNEFVNTNSLSVKLLNLSLIHI